MKSKITALYCLFLFCCVQVCFGQGQEEVSVKIESKIEKEFIEKQVVLKAIVDNEGTTFQDLNYLFIAIKKGANNNLSNNKQAGKFSLKPNESKVLSQLSVNLEDGEALKVYLYIRDEESSKLIKKDSVEINKSSFKPSAEKVEKQASSELQGLTIDETKTKVGRDFYDLFYIQYSQLPNKGTTNITITELPTRGTSSQINIIMEDKVIYGFPSNPSEEYMVEQVNTAFRYINNFNANKNLIKNEFIY